MNRASRNRTGRWAMCLILATTTGLAGLGYGAPRPTPPAAPQNAALATARKAVNDAQLEATKIQMQMHKAEQRVEASFADKPDWSAALSADKTAQSEYDAAVMAVREKVHQTPEYLELAQKKKAADEKLMAAGRADDQTSKEDLEAAADERTKSALAMKKMESQALAEDSKVANAKEKLTQSHKGVAALRAQVTDAAQQDPEWIAAKQLLDQAQKNVQQAKDALAQIEHPKAPPRGPAN